MPAGRTIPSRFHWGWFMIEELNKYLYLFHDVLHRLRYVLLRCCCERHPLPVVVYTAVTVFGTVVDLTADWFVLCTELGAEQLSNSQ